MNWNEFRKDYKEKHGPTSVAILSNKYKTYKNKSPKKKMVSPRKLKAGQGRGSAKNSPTRGWAKNSPKKGIERHNLKATCGASAFLDPKNEKYPVKNQKCEYVCEALNSAKNRACQYDHEAIADRAQKLGQKHCNFSPKKHACKK